MRITIINSLKRLFLICKPVRRTLIAVILAGVISVFGAPGDLDPTFGQGGITVTSFSQMPYWDYPRAIQVQPDGKIVVCGEIRQDVGDFSDGNFATVSFFIARYNPNGDLDSSFGANGKVIAPLNSGDEFVGYDIALQPDGKILAVGVNGTGYDIAVNRYNPDGTLDRSFGAGGKVVSKVGTINSEANSVMVQPDGKIVVVGIASSDSFNGGFGVVRYNADGSLDTGFGEGGKVITGFVDNGGAAARAVMHQPNGKIIVAGQAWTSTGGYDSHYGLIRYNADGSLDASFGTDGKVIQSFPNAEGYFTDAVLDSDGKIVVSGYLSSANPVTLGIVRFNTNGSVDTAFAADGIFATPYTSFMGDGLAVQPDGKIVSFGRVPFAVSAVLRLNQNGSPDTGFGTNGIANTNLGTSYGLAGAIQPDGRILYLGYTWTGGDIALARFLGDPGSTVSGRVLTPSGQSLRNAVVTITDSNGKSRSSVTSTLGFFAFTDMPVGITATISVSSRRYRFQPITRTVNENLTEIDIVGIE